VAVDDLIGINSVLHDPIATSASMTWAKSRWVP
jgi:hypothetical protein